MTVCCFNKSCRNGNDSVVFVGFVDDSVVFVGSVNDSVVDMSGEDEITVRSPSSFTACNKR